MYCKICNSKNVYKINHTLKCKECGALLFYPYPTDLSIKDDMIDFWKEFFKNWYKKAAKFNHRNFTRMFEFAVSETWREGIKILDYGGGGGQFSCVCKSYFFDSSIYITDINDHALLGEYRPFVSQIKYADFKQDTTCFDYIFLNDVYEHVNDPIKVLSVLSQKLTPSGKIFIDTPKQFWFYPVMRKCCFYLYRKIIGITVSEMHLQLWTKKSFELSVKKAGLKITKYKEVTEFTMPADFYIDHMWIKNKALKFCYRMGYKLAPLLFKNKIMSVIEKA